MIFESGNYMINIRLLDFTRIFLLQRKHLIPNLVPLPLIIFRLCVDIFRVLTFDDVHLTPLSLITYVNNRKDFFPLSIAQLFWLFEFQDEGQPPYEVEKFVKKFFYQMLNVLTKNQRIFSAHEIFKEQEIKIDKDIECYSKKRNIEYEESSSSSSSNSSSDEDDVLEFDDLKSKNK